MQKIFITLATALLSLASLQAQTLEELCQQIDRDITHRTTYEEKREDRIKALKQLLDSSANDGDARYHILSQLVEEYQSYQSDSAMTYLELCCATAQEIHRTDLQADGLIRMAFQCSTSGYYNEALTYLHRVPVDELSRDLRARYYFARNHVYKDMAYYSSRPDLQAEYAAQADACRDSVYVYADPKSDQYLQLRELQLYAEGRLDEAMTVNDQRMEQVQPDSHPFAIVAYYRSLLCLANGHRDEALRWLALSARNDVENAVLDQASLWTLAAELSHDDSQLERAYDYVSYSWDAANRFGTKVRSSQISPILRVIEENYQRQISASNVKMRVYIVALALLVLLFLFLLYSLTRQHRKLASAQADLQQANSSLDERNRQLSDTNRQLSVLNAKLNESNLVKEEYIGRFLGQCFAYINRHETFRKRVNKMVKNRQLDELLQLTKSAEYGEKELDELYASFDEAFLRLFPNFIEDFNSLLKPEEVITLTEDHRMPTSLRIFALIRLGIDDSSRIAEFLHYSVNTIYNYRARVKNAAIGDRDDFERNVKELGLHDD